MKLADQIELLRLNMFGEHHRLVERVIDLDATLAQNDAEILGRFQGMLASQGRRAADIQMAMQMLQSRIGYGPQAEHGAAPAYPAAGHRIEPEIQEDSATKAVAARYAPPLRSESTLGDDLGIYDGGDSRPGYGPN